MTPDRLERPEEASANQGPESTGARFMTPDKFEKLEKAVARLLVSYETLKAENQGLKAALKVKDAEIEELREKLGKMDRQKGIIRDKVDLLLGKLETLTQGA